MRGSTGSVVRERQCLVHPIDELIRDQIAPVLKRLGFKRNKRLFTMNDAQGNTAVVEVRKYYNRMFAADAGFVVELHMLPKIWTDYREWLAGGLVPVDGMLRRVVRANRTGPAGHVWYVDLGDEAARQKLSDIVNTAVVDFLRYLDIAELARYLPEASAAGDRVPPRLLWQALTCAALGRRKEAELVFAKLEAQPPLGMLEPSDFIAFVRAWIAGEQLKPLREILQERKVRSPPPGRFAQMTPDKSDGSWEAVTEDRETPWGDPRLASSDYLYPANRTSSGIRTLITPDGRTHEFRFYSNADVKIELSEDAFASLGDFPRYLRSLGLGKLRRDLTVALTPAPDVMWVQAVQDDATLVLKPPGAEPSFFRLGPLGLSALRIAHVGSVSVTLFIGTDVLPIPTWRKEDLARLADRAWGGFVACNEAGPNHPSSMGTALAHYAAINPEWVLEGTEAAGLALQRSGQLWH